MLNYERPSVENDDKTLTAPTLNDLLAEMQKNRTDFDEACIRTVRNNAMLIPAVVFDGWKKTTPNMVNPYELLTKALNGFYTTPNAENYKVVLGIYARCACFNH
jgi:hypothetical protein